MQVVVKFGTFINFSNLHNFCFSDICMFHYQGGSIIKKIIYQINKQQVNNY